MEFSPFLCGLLSFGLLGLGAIFECFRIKRSLVRVPDIANRIARVSCDLNLLAKRVSKINDTLTRLETSPILPLSALRVNMTVKGPQEWKTLIDTLNLRNHDDEVPAMSEPTVSRILGQLVGGRREIPAADGVADMITPYHLIEIKQFRYWQKAICQLRRYRRAFPGRKPILCCFGRRPSLASLEILYKTCVNEGISLVDFADLVRDVSVHVVPGPLPSRQMFVQEAVQALRDNPAPDMFRMSRCGFMSHLANVYPPVSLLTNTPLPPQERMEELLAQYWRKLARGEWDCQRVQLIEFLFESGYCRPIDIALEVRRSMRAYSSEWCSEDKESTSSKESSS